MEAMENKTCVSYIDSSKDNAKYLFADVFYGLLQDCVGQSRNIVVLCIGTDRATGDSFGPLVGHKLMGTVKDVQNVSVYGTLDTPVHAKNISKIIQHITSVYENPFVIAVDASLGRLESIGYLTLGKGSVRPGAALSKNLPHVGDIFVTGIVNYVGGAMELFILQNTSLNRVMKMADIVYYGIAAALFRLERENF